MGEEEEEESWLVAAVGSSAWQLARCEIRRRGQPDESREPVDFEWKKLEQIEMCELALLCVRSILFSRSVEFASFDGDDLFVSV